MENDTSLSKNSQVKNLLDKFQQSEEATMEDLKLLDGFVKDGKKNHKDIAEASKKPKEIIELKEEKPTNDDDHENININTDKNDQENNKFEFMNKSNIFEKGLRDRTSTDSSIFKKNLGRVSLSDNYHQKQSMMFNKQTNNINKEIKEENELSNLQQINENTDNQNDKLNTSIDLTNEDKNKFSNININEEYSNNNKQNQENKENNNEIKEEIDETQSNFQDKIINNTQTQLSDTHIKNLVITQSSYTVESNLETNKLVKKPLIISKANNVCYKMNTNQKKYEENLFETHNEEFGLNNLNPEEKLINSIDNNIIDNIENKEDLKEIENCVEKLLGEVRCKIGNEENDPVMNKMIEKYSKLILEKINEN